MTHSGCKKLKKRRGMSVGTVFPFLQMNSAPFRTQSSPPTRAFGAGGGLSFAERAAAFRSTSEPAAATTATASNSAAANARIMPTSAVAATTEVTAPVAKPTFEKAPKLSAAAQAAYVPKNARPADVKVLPTADMFPALPSKNSAAKTEPVAKSENKKPTFADIMKKRVEQDAIEAEIAERERLREQERKEREERDNRYIQIGTRGNSAAVAHYEEEEDVDQGYDGMYEENAFARPTGGYNPSDYGYNAEEEMAPPVEDMGVPNDDEW
jgi:hypothetical protein